MTTIRFDARDLAVLELQRALLARGRTLPRHGADGHLGAETWAALVEFAADHGIAMVSAAVARAGRVPVPPDVLELLREPARSLEPAGSPILLPGQPPPVERWQAPERGLVVAGQLVPGTEWIRRDPERAWWRPGERGTRPRARVRDLVGFHWTAGEAGVRDPDGPLGPLDEYDDDAARVVAAMRARLRPDGSPMSVGIDFVIGACPPDAKWAPLWQTIDIGLCAAVHMGRGEINARCPAAEIVSAGLPDKPGKPRRDLRNRPQITMPVYGRQLRQLAFYPGQIRTALALAELLASLDGLAGIRIPRRVPLGLTRAMGLPELRRYAGAIEHLHCPPNEKIDAGGQIVTVLRDAGWAEA